jgi:hypothetical protein
VLILAASAGGSAAPGALGFLVVFGMAVVLFFVFRSMSRHLRKVNDAARHEDEAREARAFAGLADGQPGAEGPSGRAASAPGHAPGAAAPGAAGPAGLGGGPQPAPRARP